MTLTVEVRDTNTGSGISGASVYIDGSLAGSTDSSGNAVVSMTYPPANHQISVSASGYETNTGALVLGSSQSGGYITVRLTRGPQSGAVTFAVHVVDLSTGSPVYGASVLLDGNFQGTTDSNGKVAVSTTYPPAEHFYQVSASGYQTASGSWTIGSNSGGYVVVRLTPMAPQSATAVFVTITTTQPLPITIISTATMSQGLLQANPSQNTIEAFLTTPGWETFAAIALIAGFIASLITIRSVINRRKETGTDR